jgi:hypothetical protein
MERRNVFSLAGVQTPYRPGSSESLNRQSKLGPKISHVICMNFGLQIFPVLQLKRKIEFQTHYKKTGSPEVQYVTWSFRQNTYLFSKMNEIRDFMQPLFKMVSLTQSSGI